MWTRLPLSYSRAQHHLLPRNCPDHFAVFVKWGRTVADDARRSNHGPRSSADTQGWFRPVFTYLWSPDTKTWRRRYAADRRKVNQSFSKGLARETRNGHSGRRRSHRDLRPDGPSRVNIRLHHICSVVFFEAFLSPVG